MFKEFQKNVQDQFEKMQEGPLFLVNTDKDVIWNLYLSAFPAGTDPLYRTRTEHDCSCCKHFIRTAGGVVTIDPATFTVTTVWSNWEALPTPYREVAKALNNYVLAQPIVDIFLHYEDHVGVDHNFEQADPALPVLRFDHFYLEVPSKSRLAKDRIPSEKGAYRSSVAVFQRALEEITEDAVAVVLDLINQNSLYRGEEHKATVAGFKVRKFAYMKQAPEQRVLYAWYWAKNNLPITHIRNSAIGTLLVDLSNGDDLTSAVGAFEAKVAPANYKRTTALVTPAMIKKAEETVTELGLEPALHRRFAVTSDLSVNDILFADRSAVPSLQGSSIFKDLAASAPLKGKKFDKVEEVPIETFIESVLPTATALELMVENKHTANLMSLVAPVSPDSPPLFKWDNGFSWAYNGDVADSIKERVKRAGGNVDAVVRFSLSWFNFDDLDARAEEPSGRTIWYGAKRSPYTTGELDVDMNVSPTTREPVENIVWTDKRRMPEGEYTFFVNQFSKREPTNVGFQAEIECAGEVYSFNYAKALRQGETIEVAKVRFSREKGLTFLNSLPSTQASKEVWGLTTQQFCPVRLVLNSPNHWHSTKPTGNKHYFFILDKAKAPGDVRGFFNEFLRGDLDKHRKVFELLGAKLMAPANDEQLSGLGFSSTVRNSVLCKVTGSFSRVIRITF